MCPYSDFFWSVFFRVWTEYGEMRRIPPYSVEIREKMDQKVSKHGYFPRSDFFNLVIISERKATFLH